MVKQFWKEHVCNIIFISMLFLFIIFALCRADIETMFIWDHDTDTLGQDKMLVNETWQELLLMCRGNTLSIVNLCFSNVDTKADGNVYIKLIDRGGVEVYSWECEILSIVEGDYMQFEMPEQLSDIQHRELKLAIRCDSCIEGLEITDVCYVYDSISRKIIYFLLVVMIVIIMAMAFWVGKSKKMKLEQKFFVFAFVAGVCYMITIPLSQSPDDLLHFARIWDILKGNIISQLNGIEAGGMLPANLYGGLGFGSEYTDIFINFHQKIDLNLERWYSFSNTALYSPVAYLPEVIGVWIGKLLNQQVLFMVWTGRLAGLLFSLVVIYQAIRIIPYKKYSVLLISLLPIFLQEEVALGTDYFVNAVLIFWVAYILSLSLEEKRMENKQLCLLSLLSFSVAICKVVYLPFCLLLFLVPDRKFVNRKQALFFKIGNIAIGIFFNLLWMAGTSDFIDCFTGYSDSKGQVRYIITHPIRYLQIIYNTIAVDGNGLVFGSFGRGLGWVSNIEINSLVILVLIVLFILLGLCDTDDSTSIGKTYKVVLGLISASVMALTFTSLYVQFTRVGNDLIEGLQGRYFIPLLLPVSLMMGGKLHWKEKRNYDIYFFTFLGYVHAIGIITIVKTLAV